MKEIVIPKRTLVTTLLLLSLGAIAIWWVPRLIGAINYGEFEAQTLISVPQSQPSVNEDASAQAAAIAGAQAFYSIDYQEGFQTWLDRLCSLSTETGCIVYQNIIGPSLWADFDQAKSATTATVVSQGKVQEQLAASRGNAPMQVWRVEIELSAPLPQQSDPQTRFPALALVIKEGSTWKFERFLSEEEAQALGKNGGLP